MSYKIDLDKICDKNEAKNEKKQMKIFKKVIDEYSKLSNLDFRKECKFAKNDYEVFDCLFQITVVQPQSFEKFHNILKKYNFNDKTYLDYAIKKITKNARNKDTFIHGLINIGILSEMYEIKNKSVNLKSFGGVYKFFLANEYYVQNQEITSYIQNIEVGRKCHANALFLLKCLKKGEAITAKCSTMFNSKFYHSYYRYEGKVCDLNINCVMPEKDYNDIYNPEIISIVNIENLEYKKNDVKNNCKSTLEELLGIAVYKEIMNRRM